MKMGNNLSKNNYTQLTVVSVFPVSKPGDIPNVFAKEPKSNEIIAFTINPAPPEGTILNTINNDGYYSLIPNKKLIEEDGKWMYKGS